MATRKLLIWFEKRRKSKTLGLAQKQISLAMSTTVDLDQALKAFSNGQRAKLENITEQLFQREEKIDDLRRAALEALTKEELPRSYREDLKQLIHYLDEFADMVKDSARTLRILGWPIFPKEIMEQYLKISDYLVKEVNALGECIAVLGITALKVKETAQHVAFYEDKIDDEYLKTKILFLKYGDELQPGTALGLRDLLEFMERSADIALRTSDYLRMLAASEIP